MNHQSPNMARAEMLISQGRFDLAQEHLHLALAEDPNDPLAHAWLAICFEEGDQLIHATDEAKKAVGLAPDEAFFHYVLARTFNARRMPKEAEFAIRQSLELDPSDSSAWSLLAGLKLQAKKYQEALEAADKGLELDPEDTGCLNVRAMSQQGLGLKLDAERTIEGALKRRPDNAFTHANMGWSMLHQGEPRKAMEHFREALRLEPNLEWARQGIIEAMKARFILYRWFLAYFLWMQRLPSNVQWGIIIGAWIASRIVRSVSKSNPELAPFLTPLLILYFAFCATSWFAVPFFNLLLRIDRFGRLVLSRAETFAANMLGLALIPTIVTGIGWAIKGGIWEDLFFAVAPFTLPVAVAGNTREGTPRRIMWGIAAAATIAGGYFTTTFLLGHPFNKPLFSFYVLSCLLSLLAANLLNTLTPGPRKGSRDA